MAFRQALKSSSAGNKVVFNLAVGVASTLAYCDPTDIDSSAGAQVLSLGGVITTTLNWIGAYTPDVPTAFPAVTDVRAGVRYGPTGTEYTGTFVCTHTTDGKSYYRAAA